MNLFFALKPLFKKKLDFLIVAKTLGLGEKQKANEYFTFIIIATAVTGAILAALGIVFSRPVAKLLGAEGETLEYAVRYCSVVLLALPCFMLQNSFQNFFVTAEKPKLALAVTVMAGVTNIVLDALFIAVFHWGLEGAAAATAISQCVGGLAPVVYFLSKNTAIIGFCKTKAYWRVLLQTCFNGSSELMSNISSSVVTILYNYQLLRFAGDNGVAAYGAIMYVAFIFVAIFIGFVIGASPIVSFHYGAGNTDELKSLRKKGINIVFLVGAAMLGIALLLSVPLCKLFVGYDAELYGITHRGFIVYAFSYLICGFNIFGSSFFTALNNGGVSAIISFLRTLVFQIAAVLILPEIYRSASDSVVFPASTWARIPIVSFLFTAFLLSRKYPIYYIIY